jgi:Antitoxin Phd_YefM, type II toxin-antitoxin system
MKQVPLSDVEKDFATYLRLAAEEEIVIMRDGEPAGVLIGFATGEHGFDDRLECDPRFLKRIETVRQSLRTRGGVRLEDVPE